MLGVTGLSTAPEFSRPQIGPPPAGFRNARPCSKTYGTIPATVQADGTTPLPKFQGKVRDYAVCGYTPRQYRGAYGVSATGLNGKGQTIGIVDAFAAGTILKDANTYARRHGDQPFGKGQFTQNMPRTFHLHPTQCQTPADWAGEETLDVEAAHGMATKAHVIYYGAQSCLNQDLQYALGRVDDQNKVSVVSNSYGGPTVGETAGDIAAWEQVILQGEMQGITFLFSSGDNGDWQALLGFKDTDYPASDPFVTAVGGTSTAIGAKDQLLWQTGWGTHKFSLSADGKSWTPIAADPVPVRSRRRLLVRVRAAELPERRRPRRLGACVSRCRARRRSDDRHAGRGDADLPEGREVRRVPHRRHEPGVAAHGRRRRRHGAAREQPARLPEHRHLQAGGGPHRRVHRRDAGAPARTSAPTSQTAWTSSTATSTASARSTRTRASPRLPAGTT